MKSTRTSWVRDSPLLVFLPPCDWTDDGEVAVLRLTGTTATVRSASVPTSRSAEWAAMLEWLAHHLFLIAVLVCGLLTEVAILFWQGVA